MIFVVEDDDALRRSVVEFLEATGHQVVDFGDAESALAAVKDAAPDVLVSDLSLPGMSGLELCTEVGGMDPAVVRVLMTAHGTVSTAVKAMRSGCYEYLEKPVDLFQLGRLLERALVEKRARAELTWHRTRSDSALEGLLGDSEPMRVLKTRLGTVAALDHPGPPVLLVGETGVGKTRVARALHDEADAAAPFIQVNCAALPEALIEAELFGHERAAFTDARQARTGLFEAAHEGTLFLDEIGEMPVTTQAKLLSVVETGRFRRLGAVREREVRVRLIAATNVDLDEAMRQGRFRRDLYHRLSAFEVQVPPLRERDDDILTLAERFLADAATRYRRGVRDLAPDARQALLTQPWPGNVRELMFTVERAVLSAPAHATVLRADDLHLSGAQRGPSERSTPAGPPGAVPAPPVRSVPGAEDRHVFLPPEGIAFDALEQEILVAALTHTGGNVAKAATYLHLGRDQLRYRIKRLELDPKQFASSDR